MWIEVRFKDYNGAIIEMIYREPLQRKGYCLIRYKNAYYKLWGGIRNSFRIII